MATQPRIAPVDPDSGFGFNAKLPAAQQAARRYSYRMVREVSQETRRALKSIVARGIREGIPPYDLARLIVGTPGNPGLIGLTVSQSNAVLNYRESLINQGRSAAQVERMASRYAKRKLIQRGQAIARTETMRALNAGMTESWKQAQAAGLLRKNANIEWMVSPDDRLCDLCMGMEGEVAPVGGVFKGNYFPPAHPMCRCTVGITANSLRGGQAPFVRGPEGLVPRPPTILPPRTAVVRAPKAARKAQQPRDVSQEPLAKLIRGEDPTGFAWQDKSFQNVVLRQSNDFVASTIQKSVASASERLSKLGLDARLGGKRLPLSFSRRMDATGVFRYRYNASQGLQRSMVLNPDADAFIMRGESYSRTHRSFFATPTAQGVVEHEAGHALHWNRLMEMGQKSFPTDKGNAVRAAARFWDTKMTAEEVRVASKVSRYAAADADRAEFIAETFSGLVDGKTYGDDVMAQYRRFLGPQIESIPSTIRAPASMREAIRTLGPEPAKKWSSEWVQWKADEEAILQRYGVIG